jgi:hypothetical protein
MAGNFHFLTAKIGQLTKKQTLLRRIFLELKPLILSLPGVLQVVALCSMQRQNG